MAENINHSSVTKVHLSLMAVGVGSNPNHVVLIVLWTKNIL